VIVSVIYYGAIYKLVCVCDTNHIVRERSGVKKCRPIKEVGGRSVLVSPIASLYVTFSCLSPPDWKMSLSCSERVGVMRVIFW